MARGEYQAQQVVADVVVERRIQIGPAGFLLDFELAADLLVLALEELLAAQEIDRAMLGGGHQPRARIVGDARLRPALQRGDERVLRQFLGEADVTHDACEAGDQPWGFDPPDRVDGAMCFGGRHGSRLEHRRAPMQGGPFGLRRYYSFGPTCSKNSQARTSMPQPICAPRCAAGCFEAISTASSMFFASTMKNAPTISLASLNGPSVTRGLSLPGRIDFQYCGIDSDPMALTLPVASNAASWLRHFLT